MFVPKVAVLSDLQVSANGHCHGIYYVLAELGSRPRQVSIRWIFMNNFSILLDLKGLPIQHKYSQGNLEDLGMVDAMPPVAVFAEAFTVVGRQYDHRRARQRFE